MHFTLVAALCLAAWLLQDCYHNPWGVVSTKCTHARDVGIMCDARAATPVRLVGGPSTKWGRLEVQVMGQWGTVRREVKCHNCCPAPTSVLSGGVRCLCIGGYWCAITRSAPGLAPQVCTDGLSEVRRDEVAQVVCRQLGYPSYNARAIGSALYGKVRMPSCQSLVLCVCSCEPGLLRAARSGNGAC